LAALQPSARRSARQLVERDHVRARWADTRAIRDLAVAAGAGDRGRARLRIGVRAHRRWWGGLGPADRWRGRRIGGVDIAEVVAEDRLREGHAEGGCQLTRARVAIVGVLC